MRIMARFPWALGVPSEVTNAITPPSPTARGEKNKHCLVRVPEELRKYCVPIEGLWTSRTLLRGGGETKAQNNSAISTDGLEETKEESRVLLAPCPALVKAVSLCSLNLKVSFTSTFFKTYSVPEDCVLEVSISLASRWHRMPPWILSPPIMQVFQHCWCSHSLWEDQYLWGETAHTLFPSSHKARALLLCQNSQLKHQFMHISCITEVSSAQLFRAVHSCTVVHLNKGRIIQV